VLTDRGTEFCGTQSHEYELYLAVEDIDHSDSDQSTAAEPCCYCVTVLQKDRIAGAAKNVTNSPRLI
jgi:hypothetical protein